MRLLYAFFGALLGVIIDLLVNLLAAAIQSRQVSEQLMNISIAWLIGLIIGGVVLGMWFAVPIELYPHNNATTNTEDKKRKISHNSIKITRLNALLSYAKLRGQGIALTDIITFGSIIDIDTRK